MIWIDECNDGNKQMGWGVGRNGDKRMGSDKTDVSQLLSYLRRRRNVIWSVEFYTGSEFNKTGSHDRKEQQMIRDTHNNV